MIYVCVPVHSEARTAGLVLWKVRQVFTAFQREYQLLVCDDGSTDGTADVLASYARVLPMTVLTHTARVGYARSVEELLRLALQRTDRPKRDCAIIIHADFAHAPEAMEDMVKRLESGADLVVAEQLRDDGRTPWSLRMARRLTPRLLPVAGVRDTVSGYLALRLAVLRQATRGDAPPSRSLLRTDGWCANAELLARLAPHARRLETVRAVARYDLHQRPSRVRPWQELVAAWHARPVIRAVRAATAGTTTALLLLAAPLRGQSDSARASVALPIGAIVAAPAPTPVPFQVGERLRYQAKYGIFNVGNATMEVASLDTVRGVETVHFVFRIVGGALWYHLDQTMESWVGKRDFRSRRFQQDTDERGKQWHRRYDIFPDSGFYREEGKDSTFPTVADPLDDAAFLYWIRTVPLEQGKRYEYRRYFRPDRNPVIVTVVGHERVSVAGHKWNAIVVRPAIPNGRGIFAEKADARMWLSDDDRRVMLALQSNFSFGQVTLKLKEFAVPEQP
ncbi:MAG: hypothetical protein AUH42_02740 [Gemmatimonadetes bacterium 13_1_40CM_70_11]|nr:MAG: hypothetical protein AUH42_02740 [Gemmatimonadetes bacterium 13_1_40CM_70_11]